MAPCDPPAAPSQNKPEWRTSGTRTRVAILSLLFNWPSTGGGTIHTAETAKFLSRAGYDVCHLFARYEPWGVGRIEEPLGYPSQPIEFTAETWTADGIRERFRTAVDDFVPDWVIITDSWNTKPLLAEAVRGYRYFLRLAALECLCPLNNVRLLWNEAGGLGRCSKHQLATADACRSCVQQHGRHSGGLHRADRALAGFGGADHDARLRRAFAEAEAVLVVNPLIEALVAPYARRVCVVPSGFDPARFTVEAMPQAHQPDRTRLIFAGLTEEPMKGWHVLREACRALWSRRQDFEVLVTADPPESPEPFARYIGWQPQSELPRRLKEADLLVFPTIAEEALGRSAVEAMAVGRPVVASRIGGLQFTVVDGTTGLLCEPGDAVDLGRKIERLIDDPALRERMGLAGRRRFEEHYTWDVVLERHYRPLLGPAVRTPA